MDPVQTVSSTTAPSADIPATPQTASASQSDAFQLALSAALNPANVLADAGGDDDDDDGSSLSIGMSIGLPIA